MIKQLLPTRKWYDLQQAADRLTEIIGKTVTKKDLIYYASQGYLELSTYLDFSKNEFNEYKINIYNITMQEIIADIQFFEFRAISTDPTQENYYTDTVKLIVKDEFSYDIFFNDSKEMYGDEFIENLMQQPKIKEETLNNKKVLLKTNIELAKGLFVIDFLDFDYLVLNENKLEINCSEVLFRLSRHDKNENHLSIFMQALKRDKENIIEKLLLSDKNILVSENEIQILLNGGKKIRSLSTIESYIDEFKNPTRQIIQNPDKEKSIAKSKPSHRPPKIKEKEKAIEVARKTFKKYPDANLSCLIAWILPYLENKYNIKLSENTLRNTLKSANIGKHKGKSYSKLEIPD
ncbi:MAG: hypothetical protein Q4A81_04680 [Pasteurellaceae bacterium]|nr:hypothetical protein [Pasteurellaceae bacterium]